MPQAPGKSRSSWNVHLGRIAGIEIRANVTFLVLLAWIVIGQLVAGKGVLAALSGAGLLICVFGIIVVHELAHALVARRFGVATHDITLLPIGGVSSLERIPDKPRQELLIALAGPMVNVVLAMALFALLAIARGVLVPSGQPTLAGTVVATLAWINVGLALFNLLPAFPMDGGRVLRAGLALRMSYDRATAVAARLGQAAALAFGLLGIFYNPFLVLIALFVWVGAQHERTMVHIRATLTGVPVERAMITRFSTLSPDDRLDAVERLALTGFQSEFPVVAGGRIVGVLDRDDLLTARPDAAVGDVMRRTFDLVASDAPIETVLPKVAAAGGHALIVAADGMPVGMLTSDSIAQLLRVDAALHGRGS